MIGDRVLKNRLTLVVGEKQKIADGLDGQMNDLKWKHDGIKIFFRQIQKLSKKDKKKGCVVILLRKITKFF